MFIYTIVEENTGQYLCNGMYIEIVIYTCVASFYSALPYTISSWIISCANK